MKIIGETKDGFLLDATKGELANLVGYYYIGSDGCPKFKIGDEIKIKEMFNKLYTWNGNKKELEKISESLRRHADLLDLTSPILQSNMGEEVSDEQ